MNRVKMHNEKHRFTEDIASVCEYGKWNKQLGDKLCAFLFAVSPILQHYKGLFQDAGFTVYLICLPWVLIRFLQESQYSKVGIKQITTFPLILYFVFSSLVHEITVSKLLYSGFMILMCILLEFGCFNIQYIFKYATFIAKLASIVLVIQYFCYYVLGFHLCVVPTDALLSESSNWVLGAQTGLVDIRGESNGFYRPSAFFLEPSHLFIYFFPILCMCLFSKDITKSRTRTALLLSVGIVLSTSGMGIVCCICVWLCHFLIYYDKAKTNIARLSNVLSLRNTVMFCSIISLVIILYFSVDSVANTINRMLLDESGSVFSGRFGQAGTLVQKLSGGALLVGLTDDRSDILYNLPGFFATLYKRGIIGVFLTYWFYVKGLFKLKAAGFWMTVIILILSFFSAHTHGTFYMMFFVSFLIEEYRK